MKEAAYHYNQQLLIILLFNILIGLPVFIILFGYTFYLMQLDLGGIENLLIIFTNILMFAVIVKPFILIYERSEEGEPLVIKEVIKEFLVTVGPVFIVSLVSFGLIYLGLALYVVPGIIMLPLIFFLPLQYRSHFNLSEWIKKSIELYKNRFVEMLFDILLWVCVIYILWWALLQLTVWIDMTPLVFGLLRMVMYLFLFPYIIFYLAGKYPVSIEVEGYRA
ncbi:hypothetical protein [Paenisporosarcina sp. OV554]|uniref:hypothetical protein n=1 Tax=Paenisporosarcina sp. OV554 TaxID=2135694 RepID=UPI000D33B88E|nr:hypothetical protein [Paenisporosarcina sp. OV554]PUB16775.1 hypothetical protein C8K15_102205 [Paenisporosarcina sp. OV554]